jgi:hypothetical protein
MYVLKCMNMSLLLEIAESGQFEPPAPSGSVPGLRPLMEVWGPVCEIGHNFCSHAGSREASE